jgi:hypothetical protein
MSGHRGHNISMKDNIQRENVQFIEKSEERVLLLEEKFNEDLEDRESMLKGEKKKMKEEVEDRFQVMILRVKEKKEQALQDLETFFKEDEEEIQVIRRDIAEVRRCLEENKGQGGSMGDQMKHKDHILNLLDGLSVKAKEINKIEPKSKIVHKVGYNDIVQRRLGRMD